MRTLPPPPPAKKLYNDLGVRQDATQEQIHAAWIRLVRHHHPDVQGGDASETYIAARHAFDVLGDPVQRAQYYETGIDPGEALRGLQAAAMELITAAAFSCICDGGADGNLLAYIRTSLNRNIAEASTEARRIGIAVERARKVRHNIQHRWKGAELARQNVLAMVDANLARDVQNQTACDQRVQILNLAVQMLNGASYETPKADPYTMFYSPHIHSFGNRS